MSESSTRQLDPDPRDLKIAEQAKVIAELIEQNKRLPRENKRLTQENQELKKRVERLESLLAIKADAKSSSKPVFKENYSLGRNRLGNPDSVKNKPSKSTSSKSTGRKPKESKAHLVSDTIKVFPKNVDRNLCIHQRFQSAWRIVDGKAVYLRYDIRDLPDSSQLPLPPGVRNTRSEFGIEVILILGFLHYWIGVSQQNAIKIMKFFTGLDLSKSQADSLLSQLADDWQQQHDAIADLIALQMVVYIDETGWKVGTKSCYTWVFSTAKHVLFRCGVSRKKAEAISVLGDFFDGIGVTDDYAAYKNLFNKHQLCWAHLIRKSIKLVLQNPDEVQYAEFLDQLCGIYHDAKAQQQCASSASGSASESASSHDTSDREAIVAQLQKRIVALCSRRDEQIITAQKAAKLDPPAEPTPPHMEAFILLQRELASNVDCLFVFVEHQDVEPTNNRSERNVRREAEIRKGARTSKTTTGAKRRSVIVTVLASLQTRLAEFTLSNVLREVDQWIDTGRSLFEIELQAIEAKRPPPA